MIRIIIADDHAIVRKGLARIVADDPDLVVSGEAGSTEDVLDLVRRQPCDVVVLDITMPGRGGLDALKALRNEHPQLPVLILSTHSEAEYALRVLKAGAGGFLTKQSAPEELIAAIRKVSAGGKYVSPAAAEKMAWTFAGDIGGPPHERLSAREYQVLRLIAAARTVKEIASELGLSETTVDTYRGRILEKMGMKRSVELVRYAVEHGLVK